MNAHHKTQRAAMVQADDARLAFIQALCELDAGRIISQLSAVLDEIRHEMQDDEAERDAIQAARLALLK